jgi:hypothetical protein
MIFYANSSSAASANALDGLPTHSIVWIHQIHVAGGASGSATMVVVFVPVFVCCGCCCTD